MKHSLINIFCLLSIFTGFAFSANPNPGSNQMRIKFGSITFTATLYDNPTATAFKGMLPMTIKMSDLN
ncbi:MAG: cyclophilin-like fold protein, partial [Terrimicrobiaceae bacterium]